MTWQVEKLIQEHEGKLRASDKEAVTKAIEQTRAAAKGDNVETLKAAIHQLEQASHALSQALYATANAQTGASAAHARPGNGVRTNRTTGLATRPLMAARKTLSTPSSWSSE